MAIGITDEKTLAESQARVVNLHRTRRNKSEVPGGEIAGDYIYIVNN